MWVGVASPWVHQEGHGTNQGGVSAKVVQTQGVVEHGGMKALGL